MHTWYAGSPQHLVLTIVDFQWSVEYKALYPSIQIPSVDPTPREPCNIGRVAWPCIHSSVGSPKVASRSVTVVLNSLWLQPHLAFWDSLPPFPVWWQEGICPAAMFDRASPVPPTSSFSRTFALVPVKSIFVVPLTDPKGTVSHMLSTGDVRAHSKMASHFSAHFLVSVLGLPGLSLVFTSRY